MLAIQLVAAEVQVGHLFQFDDLHRDSAHAKSSENSKKTGLVYWPNQVYV
jgi:hypothetical protein